HLTDFETIRLGQSKLDMLYKVSRELVTENIRRIEGERRELRQRIARINGAATRSTQLGQRLLAHVQRTVQAAGYEPRGATYLFAGSSQSSDDLMGTQFWTHFVSLAEDPELQWRSNNYRQ